MEREFEVVGTQPVRVRGGYVEPGETFRALPEEVEFYLSIGAVAATTEDALTPSSPEAVRKVMTANSKLRGGIASVPAVQSVMPGGRPKVDISQRELVRRTVDRAEARAKE